MLFSYKKYKYSTKINKIILRYNYKPIIIAQSPLQRKNYYRTLLLYNNWIYSNLLTPLGIDNYTLLKFINIFFGPYFSGFYTHITQVKLICYHILLAIYIHFYLPF